MSLTARRLNRATLRRQLLLGRERLGVVEAVRRVMALQAQEAASPYIALWNRVDGFDPADLDTAFADQAVIKASLLRLTLHAAAAEDHATFYRAMLPSLRAFRLNDRLFAAAGLSAADADALIPELVAFAAEPRSNAELKAMLDVRLGPQPEPGMWWALRVFMPLVHAPTGGPWSFGPRPSYVTPRISAPETDRAESLRRLVRRYLEGFGPASLLDVAQFVKLSRVAVRAALQDRPDALVRLGGPDGVELWDVPGGPVPAEDTPAPPRLMAMWDSVLLAYADRSRVIPPDYRRLVIRQNGDVLPTLLVDGRVAGVWRAVDGGIEASAFHRLSTADWTGLADEARALTVFLAARDPGVYRRYARWWSALPSEEVRVLPG